MIGNILDYKYNNDESGGYNELDPNDFFDSNHMTTENLLLNFLKYGGKITPACIGYKVKITSSVGYYNNVTYIIADVNHDAANTGQTNTFDIIAMQLLTNNNDTSYNTQVYRDSRTRTWLNNTYYNSLNNNLKEYIVKIKYNSYGVYYDDDYITIPSTIEIGENRGNDSGVAYPNYGGRCKALYNSSYPDRLYPEDSAYNWFTRTYSSMDYYFYVNTGGSVSNSWYGNSFYYSPIIRFKNG